MKIFIVIATYNEAGNIVPLIKRLMELPFPVEAVVVDDNSPDGTGMLAEKLSNGDKRLHVIHRSGKLGLGTALIAGFKYSIEREADFVLTMDADFSHDPSYIPAILEAAQTVDLVIGSRYVKGGRAVNSPSHRRLLSRSANLFAKVMLGLKACDCTAGFRCYKISALKSVNLDKILSNGYSFLIELLYELQSRGLSFREVPIKFADREVGISKISKNEIIKALFTVARLSWEHYMRMLWKHGSSHGPLSGLRIAFHTGRYRKVKAMLGEGRTLDIGCGRPCEHMPDQAFLRFLGRRDSVGLDLRELEGPYEFRRGSVTSMPFGDGEFDNVTAMEILEHITEVPAALAEIKRVLKPGGVFVMTTPDNSLLWKAIWAVWSGTVGRMWHHDHLVSYNAGEWREFLKEQFECAEMRRNWRFDLVFRCVPRAGKKA